jgi:hypothetical protein
MNSLKLWTVVQGLIAFEAFVAVSTSVSTVGGPELQYRVHLQWEAWLKYFVKKQVHLAAPRPLFLV